MTNGTTPAPAGATVTNEDILAELQSWNADVQQSWGELRAATAELERRIAALEAAR